MVEHVLARAEQPELVLARIKEHVPQWASCVQGLEQVEIKKMSGLSNACYRVALKDAVQLEDSLAARTYVYRKF